MGTRRQHKRTRTPRPDHQTRAEAPAAAEALTVRAYQVRPKSIDTKARSVAAVLTTEDPATVIDPGTWEVIDEVLRADGASWPDNGQVPLLDSHDRSTVTRILGSTRELAAKAGEVTGRRFFGNTPAAREAFDMIEAGHITDGSVGYRVLAATDIQPGETASVNGQKYTAGVRLLRVSTLWEIREDSVLAIGADRRAKMRGADTPPTPGVNPMSFEKWLKARGFTAADLTQPQADTLRAAWTAETTRQEAPPAPEPTPEPAPEPAPAPTPEPAPAPAPEPTPEPAPAAPGADDPAARAAGARDERARQDAIRQLAGDDIHQDLVGRALTEGWTAERAGSAFRQAQLDTRTPAVQVGDDMRGGLTRALTDAVAIRGGEVVEDRARADAADQFRGMGFHDLARITLSRHDRLDVATLSPDQLFTRAISSATFAEILGSSATRTLHRAYQEYPGTFRQWSGAREVRDFRTYNDLRLGAFGSIEQVGDGGEVPHGTLTEAKETYSANTYGRRFALTRQSWINDDLGAFARIPGNLGAAAARNIEDVGYALLVSASGVGPTMNEDAGALFLTTRTTPNYATGAGTVLADAGLTAAKILLRKVQGLASETLNVIPQVLLVPAALEHTARKLVTSQEIMETAAGSTTTAVSYWPTANTHRGSLRVVVEPRLDAATNGATAWYLVADPAQVESLVVVHLRGQQNPTIERKDPENVLGIGWWMYHDAGAAAVDWRGINRSKGA